MVKCFNCGEENRDDLKFCKMCGKELYPDMVKCKHCGANNPLNSEFCNSCGKKLNGSSIGKSKLILAVIVIVVILAVGFYLFSGSMNSDIQSTVIENTSNNENNTIDEQITSQSLNTDDVEYKMKKVDFNRLFNMYVPQDYDYSEYPPQYNSTYQWRDSNSYAPANIYYYDQSHDLNEIVSRLNEAYPGLQMVQEGNLIILSSDSGTNFVGVQSPNHEFVFIRGYDLDTSKTCANSIVFE